MQELCRCTNHVLWCGNSDAPEYVVVWKDFNMSRQQFTCHTN